MALFMSSTLYASAYHDKSIHNAQQTAVAKPETKKSTENDANNAPVTVETSKTEPTPVSTPKPAVAVTETPKSAYSELNPRLPYPNLCAEFQSLIAQYDWNIQIASAIMQAESGCNPIRDNSGLNGDGTNDVGLFQINSIHVASGLITESGRNDPAANVATAYKLYAGRGNFTAWSVYTNGKYAQYLR